MPKGHEEDGVKLGWWLNRQRQAFMVGQLDEARQERLESLGVVWDVIEEQWERSYRPVAHSHPRVAPD